MLKTEPAEDTVLHTCSVCHRSTQLPNGTSYDGVRIVIIDDQMSPIYPELTKAQYIVCIVCWLTSMGIKEL